MPVIGKLIKNLALTIVFATGTANSQASSNYWFDLLTEDAAVAIPFYSQLFGWKVQVYTKKYSLIMHDGQAIGGIAQIDDELENSNESLWLLAIPVMDLDDALEDAQEKGASVHTEPQSTSMIQRFAVIQDPQRAPLMLLHSYSLGLGAPAYNRWVWAELWTDKPEPSAEFYQDVAQVDVDWTDDNGWPVGIVNIQGRDWASITRPPFGGTPQLWMPYILVEDLAQTVTRVRELGGKVLAEASDNLGSGTMALAADPVGAAFILYEDRVSKSAAPDRKGLGADIRWGQQYNADKPASIGPRAN